ncbi:MAG: alpha-mannosidase, partial [bacterium]|nr:alpha-mannosidase [bacterium]
EWRYSGSTITQDLIVYAHSPRIDFRTSVDWNVRQQMMKVAFPVAIRATEATYDIQFGSIKRPTHWNTSWDYARFEVLGHQWADLSERGYGVSILNDCKYGYDIFKNVMRLTLLKSPIFPDTEGDRGQHEFTYALLPHEGDWFEGNTVQEAWTLNNPLRSVPQSPSQPNCSLFRLSADHVMIDTVKKSEDSNRIVLRIHEFAGARGAVEIQSDLCIQSWQESDLMERTFGEKHLESRICFDITPYEIKTFLVDVTRK